MGLSFTRRGVRSVVVPALVPDTAAGAAELAASIAGKADKAQVAAVRDALAEGLRVAAEDSDAKATAARKAAEDAAQARLDAASAASAAELATNAQMTEQASALADEAKRMAARALERGKAVQDGQAATEAELARLKASQAEAPTMADLDEMGAAFTSMDQRQAAFEAHQAGADRAASDLAARVKGIEDGLPAIASSLRDLSTAVRAAETAGKVNTDDIKALGEAITALAAKVAAIKPGAQLVALGTAPVTVGGAVVVSAGDQSAQVTLPGAKVGDVLLIDMASAVPAGWIVKQAYVPQADKVAFIITTPLLAIGAGKTLVIRTWALR